MEERERELQKTSYSWVFPSCNIVLVMELFQGSLQGFLLYGFLGENLCVLCICSILHLTVLVIILDKDPNQVNYIRKIIMVSEPL